MAAFPCRMTRTDPACSAGYAYLRAADTIAGRIEDGQITDRLPGERELARELGVSYQTLRHGIQILRDRGLIVTQHGLGSFVISGSGDP
jgi:GntR family transcriptional regulator